MVTNNKASRYALDELSVIYGDTPVTLDGTCGIVNNNLYVFNGYSYKITPNKYDNYEIYFPLFFKFNQKIISGLAFEATIKHARDEKNISKFLILTRFFLIHMIWFLLVISYLSN